VRQRKKKTILLMLAPLLHRLAFAFVADQVHPSSDRMSFVSSMVGKSLPRRRSRLIPPVVAM
jgi:hypothetical protein